MTKPITLLIVPFTMLLMLLMAHSVSASTWNLSIVPSNTITQNTPGAAIEITGNSGNSIVLLYADGHLLQGGKAPFNYSISDWVAGGHVILATDNSTGTNQTTYLTILPPPGAGGTPIYKRSTTVFVVNTNTTKSLSLNAVQSRILSAYGYALDFEGVNGNLSIPLWYMAEAVLLVSAVILFVQKGKFQYPLVLGMGIFVVFIIMGV